MSYLSLRPANIFAYLGAAISRTALPWAGGVEGCARVGAGPKPMQAETRPPLAGVALGRVGAGAKPSPLDRSRSDGAEPKQPKRSQV